MKEELDEILGSRGVEREGAELGEEEEETFVHRGVRSQVAKQGEGGGNDPLDNCPGKKSSYLIIIFISGSFSI